MRISLYQTFTDRCKSVATQPALINSARKVTIRNKEENQLVTLSFRQGFSIGRMLLLALLVEDEHVAAHSAWTQSLVSGDVPCTAVVTP